MPYSCQMCGKKFRQKQGLNAHVKANRCKFGNIKPTQQQQQPSSSSASLLALSPHSSSSSERSNSPRTSGDRHRPYPTLTSSKTTMSKEKVASSFPNSPFQPQPPQINPLTLLKLLSSQQLASTMATPSPPPPQFIPTLPTPPSQLSLAGLQNLSHILAKYREAHQANLVSMQSTTSSSTSSDLNNSNEEIDVEKSDEDETPLQIVELPENDDAFSDKSDEKRRGRRKQGKRHNQVEQSLIWLIFSQSVKDYRLRDKKEWVHIDIETTTTDTSLTQIIILIYTHTTKTTHILTTC